MADYTTEASQKALLDEIYSNLQPGDLINYRHGASSGSSGHVMIYIGDGKILHCTGSSFVYNSDPSKSYDNATNVEKTQGSINLLNASEVFTNTSSSRYLFKKTSSDSVWTFAIIRPMYRNGLSLTDEAKARLTIPYASIEKSSSCNYSGSVYSEEEITYTITIKNNSANPYTNISVIDELSDCVEIVSGSISNNGTLSNGKINWTVTVSAGSTLNLTYKVKVKSGDSYIGKTIDASNCYVSGVKTNDLFNYVSSISSSQYDLIKTKAQELLNSSYTEPLTLMKDIYQNALGKSFTTYTTAESAVKGLIAKDNISKTDELSGIVVPNYWGGLATIDYYVNNNLKIRYVKPSALMTGDIILTYDSNAKKYDAVMYISDSLLIGVRDGKASNVASSTSEVSKYLEVLIAYNKFIILRPSLVK